MLWGDVAFQPVDPGRKAEVERLIVSGEPILGGGEPPATPEPTTRAAARIRQRSTPIRWE